MVSRDVFFLGRRSQLRFFLCLAVQKDHFVWTKKIDYSLWSNESVVVKPRKEGFFLGGERARGQDWLLNGFEIGMSKFTPGPISC